MMYRLFVRPLLFLLPAETAHKLVLGLMGWLSRRAWGVALLRVVYGRPDARLSVQAFGRRLPSPLGLAAGLDKDAEAFEAFFGLGFGSVEVGTLTAEAQPGNPRPRLFRLRADRALINRMGFNNAGAGDAARRLGPRQAGRARDEGLLGINIGKTKRVAPEDAIRDYVASATLLAPHADYMVVNVSSPNTPGLRDLQAVRTLGPLLAAVRAAVDAASGSRRVPLLVKIAPDLADLDIESVVDLTLELGLDGIVAVNTTIGRGGLLTPAREVEACGAGGLSGPPLKARALDVLRRVRQRAGARLVLVSAGGVSDAADVWARLQAGATLVQVYTGLIYGGPGLVAEIHRELLQRMTAGGYSTLTEVADRSD